MERGGMDGGRRGWFDLDGRGAAADQRFLPARSAAPESLRSANTARQGNALKLGLCVDAFLWEHECKQNRFRIHRYTGSLQYLIGMLMINKIIFRW